MQLKPKEVHVWSEDLEINTEQEKEKFALLSPDEVRRAERFRFPIHKRRFIAARSALRELIGLYINVPPKSLAFGYNSYGKPSVIGADFSALQFNLAHSNELAVFAFTLNHAIGIDVEKIQDRYTQAVAKRYFTKQENEDLMLLSSEKRVSGFYCLWAYKEAVIKAIGKGLSISLSSFSVSLNSSYQTIDLENESWSLVALAVHPDYQSALATNQVIDTISYWRFADKTYNLEKQTRM